MKYIILFVFFMIAGEFRSQSSTFDIQISDVMVAPDSLFDLQEYNLGFKVNIQDTVNFKTLDLSIIDQNDSLVKSIGSYDLKYHPNGFYYLESTLNEKRTVLNHEVFFTIRLDILSYNASKKILLKDLSTPGQIKITSYIIPK